MDRPGSPHELRDQLCELAAALPGAYPDFPWGERVMKVNKKVFAFLGADDDADRRSVGVKLRESHDQALSLPGSEPMGYGLGRSGWLTIALRPDDGPPLDVLGDWIEESYRLVAPKKLVAELDALPPR